MKKLWKKLMVLITAAVLAATMPVLPVLADMVPPEQATYTPYVVSPVNSETKNVIVYGFKDTTLRVECGGASLANVKFAKNAFKTVAIKPQKAGKKVSFYLVTSYGKKGKAVTRTVINFAGEKKTASLKAPTVQKSINNRMSTVSVSAQKNTTLLIKSDKAKILAQKAFTKSGKQNIKVNIPKDAKYLYFYEKRGNQRSNVTIRKVADKIAPAAPAITKNDTQGTSVTVKGELYSSVELNYGDGWYSEGIITSKGGLTIIPGTHISGSGVTYKIRLMDLAKNVSKTVSVKYDGNPVDVAQ